MNWQKKALIQNLIARLPGQLSQFCYLRMQQISGSFRHAQSGVYLEAAQSIRDRITRCGGNLVGSKVLEVGTGRRITLPIILWLMGAERVITVDLHRYLRESITRLDLEELKRCPAEKYGLLQHRLEALRAFAGNMDSLLRLCSITYEAPADAACLAMPPKSIDYHVSYTVFEHIPADILRGILHEARRMLRPDGLAVHLIDHSDHFSHSDPSISAVNFLQYDERTWDRLAGNRYMYMNRLRADDYHGVFESAAHEIVSVDSAKDPNLLRQLELPTFRLAPRFREKSQDCLITTSSWIVSRPRQRFESAVCG